jgi:nucleotide-binding universal stress UspA family protein
MDEAFAAPDERFRKAMHDLQQLKSDHSDIRFDYLLREGDPAQEILATANQRHCDLIVIGTHGKKGLQRVIVGSVAEDVLRRAYCPVLAVRAPAD